MKDEKINICIIGVGNVGTHLSRLLSPFSKQMFLCSKNPSAKQLSKELNATYLDDTSKVPSTCDIYFICKQDKSIEETVKLLPKTSGLIVHTSGTLEIGILSTAQNHGVFYPFQSFRKEFPLQEPDFPIFIEANTKANEEFLTNLANKISSTVITASVSERQKVHLSGVFASNFVNFLIEKAYCQLPEKFDSKKILHPLLNESIKRLSQGSPKEFQTGPAVRNDVAIMQKHLSELENPDDKQIYELLSSLIVKYFAK